MNVDDSADPENYSESTITMDDIQCAGDSHLTYAAESHQHCDVSKSGLTNAAATSVVGCAEEDDLMQLMTW